MMPKSYYKRVEVVIAQLLFKGHLAYKQLGQHIAFFYDGDTLHAERTQNSKS